MLHTLSREADQNLLHRRAIIHGFVGNGIRMPFFTN
ncbi:MULTISPECIES: RAxF-45 family protein [Bacillaceae]|jgi:hypothetical protein|uniref:Uncharacterized protein n=2 Tax=Terribacillus TaxID=459532 RepID=A0AAX2EH90_9BACI|nr:hypothetical protein SAMN05421663_106228 [Terribacillus halophilus]SEN68161.1 hypothetical protein SAMN04489762_2562 [Terribacillus saccharophilus]